MFSQRTTRYIKGHYASRAWDGMWYVYVAGRGTYTGQSFETEREAVAYMRSLVRPA